MIIDTKSSSIKQKSITFINYLSNGETSYPILSLSYLWRNVKYWTELFRQIPEIQVPSVEGNDGSRYFYAYDVEFDSQGRIVIPADLREMAEIVKEVAIVGSGEKIDIWSKENYDELHKQKEFSKEYIMDLLEESDFDF